MSCASVRVSQILCVSRRCCGVCWPHLTCWAMHVPSMTSQNDISSVKNQLLDVVNSHRKVHFMNEDSPRSLPQENSSSIENSQSSNEKEISPIKKRAEMSAGGGSQLEKQLSQSLTFELLMLLLMERRRQVDQNKQTLKFLKQVKAEFEQIEAQQNMSMFLMRDLLDHAQLKAGSFSIHNEFFNLEKVIEMAYATNQKFAADKNISLIGPTCPTKDQIFFKCIHGDPRRYLQVLVNFVNNAIKFTTSGGKVTILLELVKVQDSKDLQNQLDQIREQSEQSSQLDNSDSASLLDSSDSAPDKELNEINFDDHEEVERQKLDSSEQVSEKSDTTADRQIVDIVFKITIRDTGVGISETNRDKLFQNFSKLDDTKKQNSSGVGLGLTIARDLIEAFGGTIEIKTPFEIGTDFVINLAAKSKITKEEFSAYNKNNSLAASIIARREGGQLQIELPAVRRIFESNSSISSSSPRSSFSPISGSGEGGSNHKRLSRKQIFTFRRCLVANDQTFLLKMIVILLKKEFDEVIAVTDGLQAVKKVLEKPLNYFAMIILDINMPHQDGISACSDITRYFDVQKAMKGIDLKQDIPWCASVAVADQLKRSSSIRSIVPNSKKISGTIACQSSLVRVKTVVVQAQPLIFALTSDIDSARVQYFIQNGFHSVCKQSSPVHPITKISLTDLSLTSLDKDITIEVMVEMLEISNLPIRSKILSSIGDDSSISFED